MTTKKQQIDAALSILRAAFSEPDHKPIPKELAGQVLAECFDSMAGTASVALDGKSKPTGDMHGGATNAPSLRAALGGTTKPDKESALATLQHLLAGTTPDETEDE